MTDAQMAAMHKSEMQRAAIERVTDTLDWMLRYTDAADPLTRAYLMAGLSPTHRTARLAAEAAIRVILAGEPA